MIKIRNVLIGLLIITTTLVGAQSKEVIRMKRFKDGDKAMTTITPVSYMTFNLPDKKEGYIALNIMVDSLDKNEYRVSLYAYYPKAINPVNSNIIIGYVNGMADLFTPVYVNPDNPEATYVEYYIKGSTNFIRNLDFEYLRFEHIAQIKQIETPKYFKNFLGKYYK